MLDAVALILPYGVFEESNLQYKEYLDTAFEKVTASNNAKIVISGGFSNKNFPDLSEAQSVKNYFVTKNPTFSDKLIIEETALTTARSIEIVSRLYPIHFIVCDSIRAPKVFYLAATHVLHMPEEEIYRSLGKLSLQDNGNVTTDIEYQLPNLTISGINLKRSIEEVADQIVSSMEEVAFTKYPKLHEQYIEYRKKLWGLE